MPLSANVVQDCTTRDIISGTIMPSKKMPPVSSAFSAWRALEYSKSIQSIAIMRNCSGVGEKCDTPTNVGLFNRTYSTGAPASAPAQFIDCRKKSTVASGLPTLSLGNGLHSYRPFILGTVQGDKWT